MIEIPEAFTISRQIDETLSGKRIRYAVANASPHKFAWYHGDPAEYNQRLAGKVIAGGAASGEMIRFRAGDMQVAISAPVRYYTAGEPRVKKHQLLIEFEDGTAISSTAQMWGAFVCLPQDQLTGMAHIDGGRDKPSPLSEAFDRAYFDALWTEQTPSLSVKAFLATEQRIPGLGNGVLQDILWAAQLNPRRKMETLCQTEVDRLFDTVKRLLAQMTMLGGRDTERDLFWQPGGYHTVLSNRTAGTPCPTCGTGIVKQAYLGGSVYCCPTCQPL